ncbi:MAG: radical SAM protein [Clostridia bacterium]|nr:radical SAM protein [Clostridia bacterium]MDE7328897.1 radical SAM protein [Clostridia bacterium]
MERYGKIREKRKREIVLLRGSGCAYKKCAFCDYYLDSCKSEKENFLLNSQVLQKVDGEFSDLEVINSGSVFELDKDTLDLLKTIAKDKGIKTLHFEAHYLYRDRIPALRKEFGDFDLKLKLGLETFDYDFRETVLKKGIAEKDPLAIAKNFDEANFLFGIKGQTVESMKRDIELGLERFERICVNIMCNNSSSIKPDREVVSAFVNELYPKYVNDYRVDILIENTDFGVGE